MRQRSPEDSAPELVLVALVADRNDSYLAHSLGSRDRRGRIFAVNRQNAYLPDRSLIL